jgi:hypothetical protein
MSQLGQGQIADLQFKTLWRKGKQVMDADGNLKTKNATINGDLYVKGNIHALGFGGTYRFSTMFQDNADVTSTSPESINWQTDDPQTSYLIHYFSGTPNVPYKLTVFYGDTDTTSLTISELTMAQANQNSPSGVATLVQVPINSGVYADVLTTVVVPTISPAMWYYWDPTADGYDILQVEVEQL